MKNTLNIFSILCIVFFFSCEDLEDTYKDYAGDGAIRYLGKCSNVTVTPGWQRLVVEWENSVDEVVHNIKVKWESDVKTDSVLIPSTQTSYEIKDLPNANYKISVAGIAANGNSSLYINQWGRPYTYEHEAVKSFSPVVSKYFFVKDRLVLFFADWYKNIKEAYIEYTTKEGETKQLYIDSTLVTNNKYYLVEDAIDNTLPVTIHREGAIADCEDIIPFNPIILSKEKFFTSDFTQRIKTLYGVDKPSEEYVNAIEDFGYDYNVTSFEDILYMDHLKRFYLGEHRYMDPRIFEFYNPYIPNPFPSTRAENLSTVSEMEKSLFVLQVAHDIMGVEIDRYGYNYFLGQRNHLPYVTEKEISSLPSDIIYLPSNDWEVKCNQTDLGMTGDLSYLTDNNLDTKWSPAASPTIRSYVITINLKSMQTVNGLKFVQKVAPSLMDAMYGMTSLVNVITVEASVDEVIWTPVTYNVESELGRTPGEATLINFKEPMQVQYVRLKFNDQGSETGQTYSVDIADIALYKR